MKRKRRIDALALGAVLAAALLAAPVVSSAQDASSGPVVCNDCLLYTSDAADE